jgi:hypothetical protein
LPFSSSLSSSSPLLPAVCSVQSSGSSPSAKSPRAWTTSLNSWISFAFHMSNGFRIDLAMRLMVCTKHRVWLAGPGNPSRASLRYWIMVLLLDALSPVIPRICNVHH